MVDEILQERKYLAVHLLMYTEIRRFLVTKYT